MLEDAAADELGPDTPQFWLLVAALKKFMVCVSWVDCAVCLTREACSCRAVGVQEHLMCAACLSST